MSGTGIGMDETTALLLPQTPQNHYSFWARQGCEPLGLLGGVAAPVSWVLGVSIGSSLVAGTLGMGVGMLLANCLHP